MPVFKVDKKDLLRDEEGDNIGYTKSGFDSFEPSVMGLGKISTRSKPVNALCALFDLEGFTAFCSGIDPQLEIPTFMSKFLNWLFIEIRKATIEEKDKDGYKTWHDLPFYVKFMGDGLLVLWETDVMSEVELCNVIIGMKEICENYMEIFFKKIRLQVNDPPSKIRCGMARGRVYSIGNGEDFVGPCINIASRLQKLPGILFTFSRKGIDYEDHMREKQAKKIVVKMTTIRGIGSNQLICMWKEQFDQLHSKDKKLYKDP